MPPESLNDIARSNEIIIMEDMAARVRCRKENNYPENLEKK
jgi:seryl-tRNA(Sec) selenium transferase